MIVDEHTHKVKLDSITKEEAEAFIVFLKNDKYAGGYGLVVDHHWIDIDETNKLIAKIKDRFGLDY